MSKRKAAAELFRDQNQKNFVQSAEVEADQVLSAADSQPSMRRSRMAAPSPEPEPELIKTSEELQMEKESIRVRETRFFFWRWIVVPPNVYIVHTRSGRSKPVTIGLGLSFRYRPATDAYLVVPAAMQTIGVVANCISKEKQGLNILAYVQWQIDDFEIAYRKLDFSDSKDPLGIVNAQLREQAEAAIKDMISTMSIDEVLTDKAPIIETLTIRLKSVAEGRTEDSDSSSKGLGIKIVTVQIKEAMVSSTRLWENVQAPFRHKKEQAARLSHLTMEQQIRQHEVETQERSALQEAESLAAIEQGKQTSQTNTHQAQLEEEAKRFQLSIESQLARLNEERRLADAKLEEDKTTMRRLAELGDVEAEIQLRVQGQTDELHAVQQTADLDRQQTANDSRIAMEFSQIALDEEQMKIDRLQQEILNLVNNHALIAQLIDHYPELVSAMPDIQEMRVIQTGDGYGALASLLATLTSLADGLGLSFSNDASGEVPIDQPSD